MLSHTPMWLAPPIATALLSSLISLSTVLCDKRCTLNAPNTPLTSPQNVTWCGSCQWRKILHHYLLKDLLLKDPLGFQRTPQNETSDPGHVFQRTSCPSGRSSMMKKKKLSKKIGRNSTTEEGAEFLRYLCFTHPNQSNPWPSCNEISCLSMIPKRKTGCCLKPGAGNKTAFHLFFFLSHSLYTYKTVHLLIVATFCIQKPVPNAS